VLCWTASLAFHPHAGREHERHTCSGTNHLWTCHQTRLGIARSAAIGRLLGPGLAEQPAARRAGRKPWRCRSASVPRVQQEGLDHDRSLRLSIIRRSTGWGRGAHDAF
jgi:hypothetical protein